MNAVVLSTRFMFLRMLRDLPSLAIFVGTPLLLIPILGMTFSWIPVGVPYLRGFSSPMAFFTFGILIMFQLYGGSYSQVYVKNSLLSPMKWRLHSLPFGPGSLVLGVVVSATLLSLIQGLFLMAVFRLFLGVGWEGPVVMVLALLGVALLSQLVYLGLLLVFGNQGASSMLGWIYAYGSCILGGLIVPLPLEKPFFAMLVSFGGPYSLALTAVRQSAPGGSSALAGLCLGILFAAVAVAALLVTALARRRLA